MKGIKYRCGNCAEYFTDINNHLNNTDHTGDFKIGIFEKKQRWTIRIPKQYF